ncbi:hypothetical protein ILUMI_19365, partial [Ignelater luminosus]
MTDRLDIVVFGATGFSGKYTLPYVHKFSKLGKRNLTWAVAGRSKNKLRDILNCAAKKI